MCLIRVEDRRCGADLSIRTTLVTCLTNRNEPEPRHRPLRPRFFTLYDATALKVEVALVASRMNAHFVMTSTSSQSAGSSLADADSSASSAREH